MNSTSFLGLYIVISLLAGCTSIALALLKIFKIITIPWLFVIMPACAIFVFAIAIFIFALGMQENKSKVSFK